ncbi:MAG: peptide chain release factor-like protein [Candidatus Omnitrophica bacterium]|nr:peptide chain release factor-like protein [Candidatus Omnitrophota bacterium]
MPRFSVSQKKEKDLRDRMRRLGVKERDLTERFIRSSGPGGQNVNKVSSRVYLKHGPTGVEVKCGRERSQALNRFFARRLLTGKIESMILGKASEEKKRIEKIRRQKRKRSMRSKEKILAAKRERSLKKTLRKRVGPDE